MGVSVLSSTRAVTGERQEAFAEVYAVHRDKAVRLAYLLVSDPQAAEDVAAEAFAKVYKAWRKGGIDNLPAYLRRAVVNEANSGLRRRYRDRAEARRVTGDDRGQRDVQDQAADRDEVWQALQRLPERQRAAVVLRYYEDLSEAATAQALGITEGTVKSLTSRGLDRLQRELDKGSTATREGVR